MANGCLPGNFRTYDRADQLWKEELDRFADAVLAIKEIVETCPQAIKPLLISLRSTEWTRFPRTEIFA